MSWLNTLENEIDEGFKMTLLVMEIHNIIDLHKNIKKPT